MGTVICTMLSIPFQVILHFVLPMLKQVLETICSWVSTIIEAIKELVSKVCGWLPKPFNKLCKYVVSLITILETVVKWVCQTLIKHIIEFVTIVFTVVYYLVQTICVIVNIIIGIPSLLLCRLGLSVRKKIRVCVKVLTDDADASLVPVSAIEQSISVMKEVYSTCNITVEVKGIERIIKPDLLTSTSCTFWGIFSSWNSWFIQNSCICCSKITVFVVDDFSTSGVTGYTFWGSNYCRINKYIVNDLTAMAHEVGHVLNLYHVNDPNNLMYATTSKTSYALKMLQCCIIRISPYCSPF